MQNNDRNINERQARYYNLMYEKAGRKAHNPVMLLWYWFRRRLKQFPKNPDLLVKSRIKHLHRKWAESISKQSVLDLGCGSGSAFSLWIAENAGHYTGIDLSQAALDKYEQMLRERAIGHARLMHLDFLKNGFPDNHFDCVYASGVLHHFYDFDGLCKELSRILAPGGVVISSDPLNTNAFSRIIRKGYRIFQNNRSWEWPFEKKSIEAVQRYFEIESIQGYLGTMSLCGFILSFLPGCNSKAEAIFVDGVANENRYATKIGKELWKCHVVAMLLRKLNE